MNRPFAVLAIAVLAVGAGCSDDESGSLSENDFVAHANAICAAGNAEMDELGAGTFGSATPPTDEQLLELVEGVLANVSRQIDAIDALEPPADLADSVDDWLRSARSSVEAASEQGTGFFDFEGDNPAFAETYRLGNALGMTECS